MVAVVEMDVKGDSSKARQKLGWTPKISFDELVQEMVAADLKAVKLEANRKHRHE